MKKIYFFIGALLSAGAIQAQGPQLRPIYDFHPDVKHAPGGITVKPLRSDLNNQDRAIHYSENFDAGFGIWTAAIQNGGAGFELTNTGHVNSAGNTFIIPDLLTSTPTQWVVLDSDGAPGGSYTIPEDATLTSGLIDLSGVVDISAGDYVAFEFEQFFAEWQPAETSDHLYLGVSTDGSTWTEVEISEGVGREARPNPELMSWDISAEIDGFESSVYLRFRWEGAWNYGWQIDNVQIVDIPEKDLGFVDTWRGYSNTGLTYSQVPIAQKDTIVIGAILKNFGSFDQTDASFTYVVKDPLGATVASGPAGVSLSLSNAEQDTILISTNYVPTMLGNYTVEWTATTGAVGDDVAANDLVTDAYYEITDYTYAMDYNEGTVEPITNWPLQTGEAYFGSLFDFVANDVISAIEVKLTSDAANVGEEILASVYYFPTGGTEWLSAWDISVPFTVTAGDLGEWITIPIPGGVGVNTTDLYMVLAGHYGAPAAPLFERQGDIGWNIIQGRDADGNNRGFFDRKAPLVRARVANDVSVGEEVIEDQFSIYPNPANEMINISVSLTNSENTTINVLDIAGKVIYTANLGTVNGNKMVSVSLDQMATGVYFVEMTNSTSKQVKKFVKK